MRLRCERGAKCISWTAKKTCISISEKLNTERRSFPSCQRVLLKYYRHVILRKNDKTGRRERIRSPTSLGGQHHYIPQWTNMTQEMHNSQYRSRWRRIISDVWTWLRRIKEMKMLGLLKFISLWTIINTTLENLFIYVHSVNVLFHNMYLVKRFSLTQYLR